MDRIAETEKNLGIYIHIPFCVGKCAYCDFYSKADCEQLMPEYQKALLHHIKEAAPQIEGYITDTVYFGGGTPSYYGADRIIAIFNALKKYGNVLIDSEVTAEVNPDSVTLQDLQHMRKAGFNRISIGVQSANDGILKSLGRRHDFAQAAETVENARKAGFDNISVDLIYGLPSQTREDWADTLNKAAALKPDHFSCYGLKIEKGTPLYLYKDSPFIPDDDTQADMYLYTVETLTRFGYTQYEISNFAMRGKESKHNLKYWTSQEYMGFGAAAHSYIGGQRYSYINDISTYIENILSNKTVIDHHEVITEFEKAGEYLMLGLRTTMGISESEYYKIFHCAFDLIRDKLESYVKCGWAVKNGDRWALTPQGFLISNVLIGEILEAQMEQKVIIGTPWKKRKGQETQQISVFDTHEPQPQLFQGIS
jgi:putative oxygen-independent coproporphyrinogen III oxidase